MRTWSRRIALPLFACVALAGCAGPQVERVAGVPDPVGPVAASDGPPQGDPVRRDNPALRDRQLWIFAFTISDSGPDDPRLEIPNADGLAADGLGVEIRSVDCDPGARDGLGLQPDKSYWYARTTSPPRRTRSATRPRPAAGRSASSRSRRTWAADATDAQPG